MLKNKKSKNIIFLISLPRAGSTLLQKIINTNSKFYSVGEPWFLLPILNNNSISGFEFEENAPFIFSWAKSAIKEFFMEIKNDIDIKKELTGLYVNLINELLLKKNKEYFLDKTPRYYLILEDITKYFPNSKIIILRRNPLSILSSILNSWIEKDYHLLSNYKVDLIQGMEIISNIYQNNNGNLFFANYEEIITNPSKIIKELCDFLQIDFEIEMLHTENFKDNKWKLGDPQNVYKLKDIDASRKDIWMNSISNPQYWRLLTNYLDYIGPDRYEKLGYDFKYDKNILYDNKPSAIELIFTHSLNYYISKDRKIIKKIIRKKRDFRQILNKLK